LLNRCRLIADRPQRRVAITIADCRERCQDQREH